MAKPKIIIADYKNGQWSPSPPSLRPWVRGVRSYCNANIPLDIYYLRESFKKVKNHGPDALKDHHALNRLLRFFECDEETLKKAITPYFEKTYNYSTRDYSSKQVYHWDWDFFESFLKQIGFQSPNYRPTCRIEQPSSQPHSPHHEKIFRRLTFTHPAGLSMHMNHVQDISEDALIEQYVSLRTEQHHFEHPFYDHQHKDRVSLFLKQKTHRSGVIKLHYSGHSQLDRYSQTQNFSLQSSESKPYLCPEFAHECIYTVLNAKLLSAPKMHVMPRTVFLAELHALSFLIEQTLPIHYSPALNELKEYWKKLDDQNTLELSSTRTQKNRNPVEPPDVHLLEFALQQLWEAGDQSLAMDIFYYHLRHARPLFFKLPGEVEWKNTLDSKGDHDQKPLPAQMIPHDLKLGAFLLPHEWHRRWMDHIQSDMRYYEHMTLHYQLHNETVGTLIEHVLSYQIKKNDFEQEGLSLQIRPFQTLWMESCLFACVQAGYRSFLNPIDLEKMQQRCREGWGLEALVHPYGNGMTLLDPMLRTLVRDLCSGEPELTRHALSHFKDCLDHLPHTCIEAWATWIGPDHLTGPQRLIQTLTGDHLFTRIQKSKEIDGFSQVIQWLHEKVPSSQWLWETQCVNINGLLTCRTERGIDKNYFPEHLLDWLIKSPYWIDYRHLQPDIKTLQSNATSTQKFKQDPSPDLVLQTRVPDDYNHGSSHYTLSQLSPIQFHLNQWEVVNKQYHLHNTLTSVAPEPHPLKHPKKRL